MGETGGEDFSVFLSMCKKAETVKSVVLGGVVSSGGKTVYGDGGILEIWTNGGAEGEDYEENEDGQLHEVVNQRSRVFRNGDECVTVRW